MEVFVSRKNGIWLFATDIDVLVIFCPKMEHKFMWQLGYHVIC